MVITLSVLVKYLTIIITKANINVAVIIIRDPNSNSIKPGLKTIKIPTIVNHLNNYFLRRFSYF